MNLRHALVAILMLASSATLADRASLTDNQNHLFQQVGAQRQALVPDPDLTPGVVCTPDDPDFDNYYFPEKIPRCKRHFTVGNKQTVADLYGGIPREQWSDYEFDHMLPLCAGGSNDIRNVWPEPIEQAERKDILENDICLALRAGTMTQAEALKKVYDWFRDQKNLGYTTPEGWGEQ